MAANMDAERRYAKAEAGAASRKRKSTAVDPYKPKAGAARSAAAAAKKATQVVPKTGPRGRAAAAPSSGSTTMRSTYGSKMEGPVSQRIRGAEWAYKKAQRAANLRAKARKNPTGPTAKALEAKASARKNVSARKNAAAAKRAGARVSKQGK